MSWSGTDLSTTTTIATWEADINSLTGDDWTDLIANAKGLIGARVENLLTENGVMVDESTYTLLDVVANPAVFQYTSDFLTLHLIFNQLAFGSGDSIYREKADYYEKKYQDQFDVDSKRINLDTDIDDSVDLYRANLIKVGVSAR